MNNERVNTLKRENLIWIIYVIFAYFGIKANNLEMEDIANNNDKNRRIYKTINVLIFIVSIGIYLYFINLTYKRYEQNKRKIDGLQLVGSILVLIAGFIFLYAEIYGDDVVPNEI